MWYNGTRYMYSGDKNDEKDKDGIANGDTAYFLCAVFLGAIGADSAGG